MTTTPNPGMCPECLDAPLRPRGDLCEVCGRHKDLDESDDDGDPPSWYWQVQHPTEGTGRLHRDATWRPASAAPAKGEPFYSEAVADTTTTLIDHQRPINEVEAKPAEPSPQPGGELDALTRRVEALERFRGSLVCFMRQHVDRFNEETFHEALDGVVAVSECPKSK